VLRYSNPFENASMPNRLFTNFHLKLVAMATSIKQMEKEGDSKTTTKYLPFDEKP